FVCSHRLFFPLPRRPRATLFPYTTLFRSRRLRELDRSDFDAYYDEVVQVPQGLGEWQLLLATLTVKETSFFRQPAAYDLVRGYRSEEHTSELQSRENLVCRLLLEKKKRKK